MATMAMRILDAAFGHPRGVAGRLGGAVMARGNTEQERWAVHAADVAAGAQVVVVGHGPGIGLQLLGSAVAPGGHIIGVDPSATMRDMAASRCARLLEEGSLELQDGGAERTGCADASMDAAISVNNVMLWDRPAGFAELFRVLRPGGRLVITVHRHVLGVPPERLRGDAEGAGFHVVEVNVRPRRLNSPAIRLLARRPETPADR
jgi:arsenite methyltransferase